MASRATKESKGQQAAKTARARRPARGSVAIPHPSAPGKDLGPTRRSVSARQKLEQAFEDMGGIAGFVKWGAKNPTEFYRIWARLVPKDVNLGTDGSLEELLEQLTKARSATLPGDSARIVEGTAL